MSSMDIQIAYMAMTPLEFLSPIRIFSSVTSEYSSRVASSQAWF